MVLEGFDIKILDRGYNLEVRYSNVKANTEEGLTNKKDLLNRIKKLLEGRY